MKENEKRQELTENKLNDVSGGTLTPSSPTPVATWMVCSNCGKKITWAGNYVGKTFKCSDCGQNTFTGVELY